MISYDFAIAKSAVCCSSTALARNGLIMFDAIHLDLQTGKAELDKTNYVYFSLFYNPNIDYEYCITKSPSNPLLLLPSKERALVECIKHLDWIDEGLLIEGLRNYLDNFWNEKLLFEVAKHFNLPAEELEYWLNEARNECDD